MDDVSGKVGSIVNDAKGFIAKNKTILIVAGIAAGVLFLMICICCIRCRMKRKQKKEAEKIKMKGAKPTKKLKRIQPTRIERKAMEELGSISFTLQYDAASEMLSVKVLESADVPVRDLSGYAYAYVVVKILPYHEDTDAEFKTRLCRATFWPAFADLFTFVIGRETMKEQVLYLYQYELNRWSKQDGIGMSTIELKTVDFDKHKGGEISFTKKLRPYDPLVGLEVEAGAVFLCIEYDREEWVLKIEVRQGDIIPMKDDKEKASSYVSIALLNGEDEQLDKSHTSTQRGTMQPVFGDELEFQVPDQLLEEVRLLVKLKSKRLFQKARAIGTTKVLPTSDHWKQLMENDYTEGWFSVYTKPKNK